MLLLLEKIVFDASIIAIAYGSARSGIFCVARALIEEFAKKDEIELYLYAKAESKQKAQNTINSSLKIKNLPFIFEQIPQPIKHNKIKHAIKCLINILPKPLADTIIAFIKKNLDNKKNISKNSASTENNLENLNESGYDIFFSPIFAVPEKYKNINKCVFIHDTIPFVFKEYQNNPSNFWFLQLCESLDESHICFANSAYTKKDFLKHLPHLKPENIIVTPLACDERFKPENSAAIATARKKYNIPENKKYIFSLCTLEPRKNLIRAVKCFASFIRKNNIDDLVFVLGGAHWDRFISILESEIENLNELKDKILKIGYVDDADQAALYSGALFFVYTSQYEGFGLPPLEAMSCGTPVITSNNSSLPEVVGGAAIMIDYDDDAAHIKAYEDYYFNEELRKENSKKGLEQARKFSWEKCADIMVEEFKKRIKK